MSAAGLKQRGCAAAAALLALTGPLFAQTPAPAPASPVFDLVTGQEARDWNTARSRPLEVPALKGVPRAGSRAPSCHSIPDSPASANNAPQIRIVAPLLDKPLSAPLDIDIRFLAAGNVPVQPETFRVCYMGFLVKDITRRVTERVTLSPQGFRVTGAQLPRGRHRLLMLVADRQGQLGRREVVFDIQ